MNYEKAEGWTKEQIGKAKQQWAKIGSTDFELLANGKEQEFLGKMEKAYGQSKDEAKQALAEFKKNCGCDKAA